MTVAHPEPVRASAAEEYRDRRIAHWDALARAGRRMRAPARAYHGRLGQVYRFLIPPGRRVLDLGCGDGDLLASVVPSYGVGVDFSGVTLDTARARHPHLTFVQADVHDLSALTGTFDVIILSDLLNDLWDVQGMFAQVRRLCHPGTRIIANFYSRLWERPLAAASALGMARPSLRQNWLTAADVTNLLRLNGFRTLRSWQEVLCPLPLPLIGPFCDRVLVRFPVLRHFAVANFLLARAEDLPRGASAPSVSVIVPARNEAGNVDAILARTPQMGSMTEIVFVEGHSSDDTYGTIERALASGAHPHARLLRQTGRGKGDAVRLGFEAATGDILMILDADLTVPPEDLPRFHAALQSGIGEFVNGVRLTYPMEERAMRFFNLIGNKFFSLAFSWLLGQPIKDTLCGTKVLWREDYAMLAANRGYFGDFDPFGDFDLLFGAAKLGLEIVEVPIRYRERTYGTTNIQRWRHGWLLLQMCVVAAGRIKFV
jgi:SAM-dependent methyltransferase